jgi:hypothetical protein
LSNLPLNAQYVPDLMDVHTQKAIMQALEQLYTQALEQKDNLLKEVWPASYDFDKRFGSPVPLNEIDIVVLPLDRIGAPAGASGASVYVTYFSHRGCGSIYHHALASPPLIVKIGTLKKLEEEQKSVVNWPTLSPDVQSHFAIPLPIPIFCYGEPRDLEEAVLIAPFRSQFLLDDNGTRLGVTLKDLWGLLYNSNDFFPEKSLNWTAITRYVGHALDMVAHVHRNSNAQYHSTTLRYEDSYRRYLRGTFPFKTSYDHRTDIPKNLFGEESTVIAFGQNWPNPSHIVKQLMESGTSFEGISGPVHGDLHPKNIVIGHGDKVQIIDFGWAQENVHVVVDYLLLDINIRGTTLPSQIAEKDILALANFLDPSQDPCRLHPKLKERASLIKNEIWDRCIKTAIVKDWDSEYLIPFFLVAYGLLVHLDAARNQTALIASVLAAAKRIRGNLR